MRLSEEFLSEIRFRNPIEDVISGYVELKTAGNTMKGLCPFHNEKTASFTVYPNTASYYCFGCQNGGDVITFVRQIENLDYMESVRLLADRAGLTMPESGYDDSAEKLRRRVLQINRETAKFYHKCLIDKNIGARGFAYFKQRGLSDKTIVSFGLGYAPDSGFALCNHLRALGYSDNEMIIANVAGRSKRGNVYDRFRGKMMFPLIDLRGNVIAFGGRKFPGDEGGKYINTSDTPVYKKSRNLYALNFAKNSKSDSLILCEGYMDVIALHQAGFTNAVAALGTSFTEEMASLLARYAKEVVVTMDSDAAGQRGARRAIGILNKTGIRVRVLMIEGGKDPDEYIKAYGAERFRLLLEGAKNDIEFRLFSARGKYDVESDDGKLRYIEEAVEILSEVSGDIAVNLYAGRVSEETGVSKAVILTQIEKRKKRNYEKNRKAQFRELIAPSRQAGDPNPEKHRHRRASAAEDMILSVMMNDPSLCDKALRELTADDFVTSFGKKVFESVKEIADDGKEFSLIAVSGDFSPDEMGRISQVYNTVIGGGEDALLGCIKALKEEKSSIGTVNTAEMTNEEFSSIFREIGKDKKS
ncbi:MAG: DNA primase [Acutalibacteraceae bacterium]